MNQTTRKAEIMSEPEINPQALEKIHDEKPASFSAWDSPANFETAQRMAKMLAASQMIPERYRNNIGDCVIAMEMARRIGANVLSVMQNLYVVYGSPAWSSQFLIACVNASGRFTPIRYRMTGKKGDDTWGCVAWAEDGRGEKLESPEITIAIAKAEGWFQKNGSKWKTMPELMLRYRCATLFARLYAPELTMGIQTADEIIDIAPVVTEPQFARPIFTAPTRPPTVETPPSNPPNLLAVLRVKCKAAKIKEAELIESMVANGAVEPADSLEGILLQANGQAMITLALDQWETIASTIIEGRKTK